LHHLSHSKGLGGVRHPKVSALRVSLFNGFSLAGVSSGVKRKYNKTINSK
jgi:hypothetical protein